MWWFFTVHLDLLGHFKITMYITIQGTSWKTVSTWMFQEYQWNGVTSNVMHTSKTKEMPIWWFLFSVKLQSGRGLFGFDSWVVRVHGKCTLHNYYRNILKKRKINAKYYKDDVWSVWYFGSGNVPLFCFYFQRKPEIRSM